MTKHTVAIGAACGALLAHGACGGHVLDVGANDAGRLAPADLGGIAATFASPVCPSALPSVASPCTDEGAECEYGTRASAACNAVFRCRGGVWGVASELGACHEPLDRACPSPVPREPDNRGAECPSDVGLVCYGPVPSNPSDGEEICFCNVFAGVARWDCVLRVPQDECPWPRPHLGAACASAGIVCDAFACWHGASTPPYSGVRLTCNGRYWAAVSPSGDAGICN